MSGSQAAMRGDMLPDEPRERDVATIPQKRKLIPKENPMMVERGIRGFAMVTPNPNKVTRKEIRGNENFI